jgi:hypothetical protein
MTPAATARTIDILFVLTAFATFDMLAGASRTPADVIPIVQDLVRRALGST